MALRQPPLDALLARGQPVHGLVEAVLVHVAEAQFAGQRAVAEQPRRGQLGGRAEHPFGDQRQRPVALRRAAAVEQRRHAEAAHGFEDGLDVSVRHGAFDDEGLRRGGEGFVAEDAAQQVDLFGGPGGEVGQGALADAAAFAPALAEEDGGPRVAVRDAFDVHGNIVLPNIGDRNAFFKRNRHMRGMRLHGNTMRTP